MVREHVIFVDNDENELEVFASDKDTVRIHIKDKGSEYPGDWTFFDFELEDIDMFIQQLKIAKEHLES
jgi:hypothetical protein